MTIRRRRLRPVLPRLRRLVVPAGLALLLTACVGGSPLPPVQWVRLPAEAPDTQRSAAPSVAAGPAVWQLMAPVQLPGHLDRDAVLVPQGAAGLQALGGVRWAEPLRDAVPRLLRQDLERAMGSPMWTAPVPPGVRPTRQLRIELTAFDVTADRRGVILAARWTLADVTGAGLPRVGEARIESASGSSDVDALVLAHRVALARLAQRVADSARTP